MSDDNRRLTADEVLRRYVDEDLPAFLGITLSDVNQIGHFGERPLDVAATRGNLREVAALLEGGAEVNARAEIGNTALHEAVAQGHVQVVKLLLDFGARCDIRNDSGDTPVDIALSYKRLDILEILESHH